ncbi:MAG: glycosyl hydrolase family 95 catalytic domain-containing protein [Fimbriimonadales bacterium]
MPLLALAAFSPATFPTGPAATSNLDLKAPISTWDEAIPLGNGMMGGLLWGEGDLVRLSIDRGDLWDERIPDVQREKGWSYANIQRLVKEKNQTELVRLFDAPYDNIPYPTKLPGARLELRLPKGSVLTRFGLELSSATGSANWQGGRLEAFFSAVGSGAIVSSTAKIDDFDLVAPASLKLLGYKPAETGKTADSRWLVQEAAVGLKYAVCVTRSASGKVFAIATATNREGPDPLAAAQQGARSALFARLSDHKQTHRAWWKQFWAHSAVRVPDERIQRQYDLAMYLYGSGSRRGAPPIPLQGVWTADAGTLPPWKGDFHHDLNTQLTYWPYLAAGHFDEGLTFLDFLFKQLPKGEAFAKSFYGVDGAIVPGVASLDGQPLGGWSMYSLSPTMSAWLAQAFDEHWRYGRDRRFLAGRAYPFCRAVGTALLALMNPDSNGKLKLPLSSSPEIHDNTLRAWLTPNSNFDLALLKWLFTALGDEAQALGKKDEAKRWRAVRLRLDDFAREPSGALMVDSKEPLTESHRHHSNLMAIHPLGLITVEGSAQDRRTIAASLEKLKALGTDWWCGYSFSWAACIYARAGMADDALRNLDLYAKAFVLRNGFHANGDQTKSGHSKFTYRPFTLEGNFAAAQAVHEMLLQSWGGVVRLFPAVSSTWRDVSFRDLRAEGGFKVSAIRAAGRIRSVRIEATVDGPLRLRLFPGAENFRWNRRLRRSGRDWVVTMQAGKVLRGAVRD